MKNSNHILYPYLTAQKKHQYYNLREYSYNKLLIPNTIYLNEQDYLIWFLYTILGLTSDHD